MALWFKPRDAARLWDLAARHAPSGGEDFTWFATAARAAERGMAAVIEVEDRAAVEEAVSFFALHGIEPPVVSDLRRG